MPVFRYSDPGGIEEPATLISLSSNIRFGDFSLTNSAAVGDPATSVITLDDPQSELNIVGLRAFHVSELAESSNNRVVFRGVVQNRTVKHDSLRSAITSNSRVWEVDLSDYNWHLHKRLLVDEDSNRPAETIGDRLRWLLNRAAHVNLNDYGHVVYPTRQMEPNDYRLQKPIDVLNDCCIEDMYSFWVDYNEAHGRPELFFIDPGSADYAANISFSNHIDDIDNVTVFGPNKDATLTRSPSRIAFGAAVTTTQGFAYERKDITGQQFGKLDQVAPMTNVKSMTRARRLARKFVNTHDSETDVLEWQSKIPREKVNHARHGQRVNVRFTHLPGYETITSVRLLERTVIQEEEAGDTHYLVSYKGTAPLSAPISGGGGGGGEPEPTPVATAGGVLYGPDDQTEVAGTTHAIFWGSSGDNPSPGNSTRPRDAAAFDYTGSAPSFTGFEVLATSGTLDLHVKFSFNNVATTSPVTYTGRIKLNGSVIASQAKVETGVGAHSDSDVFDLYWFDQAVVAGDLLTVDMTSSVLANLTVPLGAGDFSFVFEIQPSSTVVL